MSGIQLTYDAVEDRVLLLSNQEVTHPSWWLSRRVLLKLIHNLNSAAVAQFETEKILQRVAEGGGSDVSNDAPDDNVDEDFESYRKGMLEGSSATLQRNSKPVNDADSFPFARVVNVDIEESRRMALTLSDGVKSGLKLEFHEAGLQRFTQMCAELVNQCKW